MTNKCSIQPPPSTLIKWRGFIDSVDFDQSDLTMDEDVHLLDLSGILPENATAALIHLGFQSPDVGDYLIVGEAYDLYGIYTAEVSQSNANNQEEGQFWIPCEKTRAYLYMGKINGAGVCTITVVGWTIDNS